MTSHQLDEEAIFHIARELSDASKRITYLDQVCASDHTLRERVEALLDIHEKEQSFLNSGRPPAPTIDHTGVTEHVGEQIGRYKLLQKIGEGGFGVVYMAEQQQPVRRKVALKVIKPGMDTQAVVARFEAERQALAMMDHENIARVFDGGATDSGRPYFVMELVKGVPITEYCDKNTLATEERLRLFIKVCDAVQHAHQKGIIHRDLKPSNVLVTLADGQPIVKVIDFGVAKATNQQLTEKTLFTAFGQMIGTPQYMSPEQAEMSCLDVDTRSDVYSLGVLLYELLTGTTPLGAERLRTVGYAEMQRMIREEEAPRPSNRLSTSGEALTIIAKHRSVSPDRLQTQVRGDLDWIAMKALEKDRNRRYESASRFAEDITNYLHGYSVDARPPTLGYQLGRYVERNRLPLAVACLFLAVVTLWAGGTAWQARENWRANKLIQQQKASLLHDAKDQTNTLILQGELKSAREKLSSARALGADQSWCRLQEGHIMLHEGNYVEARQLLRELKKEFPKSTVVHSLSLIGDQLAGAEHHYLMNVGDLKDWRAVDYEDFLFRGLAQTWVHPRRAVKDLERAISMHRNNAMVHLLFARALRLEASDTPDTQIAYEIAKRATRESFISKELLSSHPMAFSEFIHSRIVLANLCQRLGGDFLQERATAVEEARAAVQATRNAEYNSLTHEARAYFFNQLGTREEEEGELFDVDIPEELVTDEFHVIAWRRVWAKLRRDDQEGALRELDRLKGNFLYENHFLVASLIDIWNASEVDLPDLQEKYSDQMSNPDRDQRGVFAHHDLAIARLLKLDKQLIYERAKVLEQFAIELGHDYTHKYISLAQYMQGHPIDPMRDLSSGPGFNRVFVEFYFLLAVDQLASGDRDQAKQFFHKAIDTGYYEFAVYWWSVAMLEKLDDPHWLPWLPNAATDRSSERLEMEEFQ